jgi:hypothetical protein
MSILSIGAKLVKISSGEKSYGCGSHLDKGPKVSFCERLLLGKDIVLNINFKIFKRVILPVVLCGCENWSVTVSEERTVRVFENRALRGILGFKLDEVKGSGENYRMSSLMICTAHTILFGCSKSRRDDWGMQRVCGDERRIQDFGGEI